MYSNTRFGEIIKELPRKHFADLVENHQSDKHNKGFKTWDHLIAMIYAQLSGTSGIRELVTSFNEQKLHHYHLGTGEVKRSTLSDANTQRDSLVFEDLCKALLAGAHRKLKSELKDLLYLIDSSPIQLRGLGYEWSKENRTLKTTGLKVHMMIEPNVSTPVWSEVTQPNVSDLDMGKQITLEKQATYVFDKGYCNYNWWYQIEQAEAKFVTRFKKNAALNIVEENDIKDENKDIILEDVVVTFKNKKPRGGHVNEYYGTPLRRVKVHRPDKSTPLIIATNDMERSAIEIADLYKKRWGIEIFFKWIKQNLKIKKFLGRSENSVKIQIFTAIITYLLVYEYCKKINLKHSLHLCMAVLRTGLFQRHSQEESEYNRQRKRREEIDSIQEMLPI